MLKKMTLSGFTVFTGAELSFADGLNVVVGENGTGKSHLLSAIYSVIANSAEQGRKPTVVAPTKTALQKSVADKLIHVMRPESLGRLASRAQGLKRCELSFDFDDSALNAGFSFATSSRSEVQVDCLPQKWHDKAPVFLPTREMLTLYPNFVSVYENHYLEISETYRDTCVLLGAPALRGPREKRIAELLQPIEQAMGGKVVLDNNGRFYLKSPGRGNMEMPLVAEGLRKLAMVARLISTGSLLDKGYLFWDEPEANLNSKLVKLVARVIYSLSQQGIQVFIATHSLFLLKELEVLSRGGEFAGISHRFFALRPVEKGVEVEQGDRVDDLQTLVLLDEELKQSDRFMEPVE